MTDTNNLDRTEKLPVLDPENVSSGPTIAFPSDPADMESPKNKSPKKKSVKKKKKHLRWPVPTWLIAVVASGFAIYTLRTFPAIPKKWIYYAGIAIGIVLLLMGILALRARKKWKFHLSWILNILLSAAMVAVTVYIPNLHNKLNNMFKTSSTENFTINVYVMNSSYKEAHPELFEDTYSSDNLADYKDVSFITQSFSDTENTEFAIKKINEELGGAITTVSYDSVFDAVQALYQNQGGTLIMSENYAELISDSEAYKEFENETTIIASYKRSVSVENNAPNAVNATTGPFIIYAAGSDTRSGELSMSDRFDVNMVVAVNPNTHQVLLLSIPRDSYIPNLALGGGYDKLTHCGVQGVQNTVNSVNYWLDTDIQYYAIVNFVTYTNIVQAIGGLDIDNPYEFETHFDPIYTYPKGMIHLDGDNCLPYVRERYNLPDGDFGRNAHQTLVMTALIDKLTSPSILKNFDNVLGALNGAFLTDFDVQNLYTLASMTLNENISWQVISYHILGSTDMAYTATAPGTELSIVRPYESDVQFIREQLDALMAGETISQHILPSSGGDPVQ